MEKKPGLLIIKSSNQSMKAAETFLKNRDWPFASTSNLTEAMKLILKHKPPYVMLPVSHPNKAVRRLPKILTQLFGTTSIAYAETASKSAMASLQEWNLPHSLYPPASGPAIIRILQKLERDAEAAREFGIPEHSAITSSGTPPDVAEMLSQLIKSEDNDSKGLGLMIAKGNAPESAPAFQQTPGAAPMGAIHAKSERPSGNLFVPPPPTVKGSEITLMPHLQPALDSAREALQFALADSKISLESDANDKPKTIGVASQLACTAITAREFSGYLVLALGSDRVMNNEVVSVVSQNFSKFMASRGETLSAEEAMMDLRIVPVEFMPWAKAQAEFLLSSIHGDQEIATAFFPSENLDIDFMPSASPEMAQMSIDEIRPDIALNFDVYLYLPENQKYLMYVRKGRSLVSVQRERLTGKGIERVHLKREAIPEVRKFKAQNFLNDKIAAFQSGGGIQDLQVS